ncbi:MAG: amino acid adenylation domain-containing protein [Streptosporangiaceae bacterium]
MAIVDAYGLTPAQAGILFHAAADPTSDAYLNHLEFEVAGPLDIDAFTAAFGWVVSRHAVLRSGFHWAEADEPLQVVHDEAPWQPAVHDLRHLAGPAQHAALRALLDARQAEPMSLTAPPLMRLTLVRLDDHRTAGLWSYHHLVLDGWSLANVYADLMHRYREGRAYDPPAPAPFRSHLAWLHAAPAGAAGDYWSSELDGAAFTQLAVVRPPGGEGYGRRTVTADTETIAGLARGARVTPGVVLHAAWALVLARYAGTGDVVFGTVVSGRSTAVTGAERMVGMFINTLPVRVRVDRHRQVGDFLRDQLAAQAAREPHEHVPLVEIVRQAGLPPGEELFATLLAVENFPVSIDPVALGEGVTIRLSHAVEHTHYPLTVTVLPGLVTTIEAEYRAGDFDGEIVAAMLDSLVHTVGELAAGLDRRLGQLAPLSPGQAHAIAARSDGGPAGPPGADVVDVFLAQAAVTPRAPAVIDQNGDTMSYAELDAQSAALARWLRERGIGPGGTVAFQLSRTARLAVAMLGILRSGASYLPIDQDSPAQRVRTVLAESRAALFLDDGLLDDGQLDQVPPGRALTQPAAWPRSAPAYMIFTSGSTGTPKGVLVSRGALADHIQTIVAAYAMTSEDRMLQIASPAFDLAAEEFFPAWAAGAAVVLAPGQLPGTVADFAAFLTRSGVTMVNMAAAYWHQWVAELTRLALPPQLRLASVGAEPIWRAETRQWLRHADRVRFFNAYGVTEATITTTLYEAAEPLPGTKMLPIGRPLPGMSVHLLDRHGDPVPAGVIGELYIGGTGVAIGYAGRPAATAERFVPAALGAPGARWYRTGDLGYWLGDGSLVLTGRADNQVKIRGHRVEPAEVEAVIAGHPAVTAVAVSAYADQGEPALAAYVVTDAMDAVRADSEAALASYLRPAVWIRLDAMPMLASGKIDRMALPVPAAAAGATPVAAAGAPATATQDWVADTWRDVLGVPAPGRADRFFHLGGHSLTATQVVARARRAFSIDLPLRSLISNPALAEFARAIDAARRGEGEASPPLLPLEAGAQPPLSYTQERLWFLDRLEGGGIGYNVTAAWRLDGPLSVPRLRGALAAVVGRHAVLRTSYPDRAGVPMVRRRDRVPVDVRVQRCPDEPAAIQAALTAEAHRPFDLAEGPLFRFVLLRLAPEAHVLVVNVHHIVFDGWSHAILMTELAACYDAPGEAALPDLAAQYHDFAAWQRAWLSGDRLAGLLDYWKHALDGPPPTLALPTTWPRSTPPRYRGGQHHFTVARPVHAAARALARDTDATLFVVLLAAFAALLARCTGQDDLVIGTPVAGRLLPETEGLIGCFFNTLALRAQITPGMTFRELATAVKQTAYAAYDHQEAPFEKVVEAVGVARELDQQPLAQVMFVFQNIPYRPLRLGDLTATTLTMPEPAKLDLILTMAEENGELVALWEYNAALFDQAAITGLTGSLVTLLDAATARPGQPLRVLPALSAAQRQEAMLAATGPVSHRAPATLPELFCAQAARSPGAPAVVTHSGDILDYATLDGRSWGLARWLREQGIRRGDTVGLAVDPTADLPVALLGILKAGAAYVPIDPAAPLARAAELCDDAAVRLVLTHRHHAARMDGLAVPVRVVPGGGETSLGRLPPITPGDLAYILFTSGSTGRPKGVAVSHRNLTAYLRWFAGHYELGASDRALGYVRYGFDLSVPELYAPLISGGTVVLADPQRRTDPRHLLTLAQAAGVTWLAATPSVLRLLAEDGGLAGCEALRLVFTCGEPLPADLITAVSGQTRARLDNQYGPTETTVAVTAWASHGRAPAGPIAPLGAPSDDCQVYLNDDLGQPVPPGAVGEIQIGGEQVASGYAGSPGLTADRFRPDPDAAVPGARLYRTGDLARRGTGGELEYVGRADRQVKVRGIRVEPGEVEAVLASHPQVGRAAVIADASRLAAFVVPADGDLPGFLAAPPDLAGFLARRLPAHLVPAALIPVGELPRTANGKVDYATLARQAVPAPAPAGHAEPATATETEIAAIYAELLGRPKVGAADDFFALGGQSLLAVRAVTRIRQRFGVELPLRTLFAAPAVAALAREVDARLLAEADEQTLAELLDQVQLEAAGLPAEREHQAPPREDDQQREMEAK